MKLYNHINICGQKYSLNCILKCHILYAIYVKNVSGKKLLWNIILYDIIITYAKYGDKGFGLNCII